MRSNNLDLFWTRDWRGRHSWKMWWTRPTEFFGKTWGLKPRMVHIITTKVIRSILTHGPTVGWLRVKYIVSRTELSQLHRLACLAVRGAMMMTPTTAMEALLGLPILHVIIETETQVWISRPTCDQTWSPKLTNFGQTKNFEIWSRNPRYRWRMTGCFQDMHTTSHSQSSSLTYVNGRLG